MPAFGGMAMAKLVARIAAKFRVAKPTACSIFVGDF